MFFLIQMLILYQVEPETDKKDEANTQAKRSEESIAADRAAAKTLVSLAFEKHINIFIVICSKIITQSSVLTFFQFSIDSIRKSKIAFAFFGVGNITTGVSWSIQNVCSENVNLNYSLGSHVLRTKQHRFRPAIMLLLMLSVNKMALLSSTKRLHRTVLFEFLIHKHKQGLIAKFLFSMANVQSFGTNSSFYNFVRFLIIFNVSS